MKTNNTTSRTKAENNNDGVLMAILFIMILIAEPTINWILELWGL